jgi:hypothetical protein
MWLKRQRMWLLYIRCPVQNFGRDTSPWLRTLIFLLGLSRQIPELNLKNYVTTVSSHVRLSLFFTAIQSFDAIRSESVLKIHRNIFHIFKTKHMGS